MDRRSEDKLVVGFGSGEMIFDKKVNLPGIFNAWSMRGKFPVGTELDDGSEPPVDYCFSTD